MIQRISGVIAAATAIRQFQKKDGTLSDQATLHIQQVTGDVYPQEIAVKVTGELAQFARMVGYNVEVDYVVRVFNFTKMGEQMIGNDVYARNIKVATPEVRGEGLVVSSEVRGEGLEVRDNISHPNSLTPNALTPNPLTPNALTPNALTPNPLLSLPAPAQQLALPAPAQVNDNDTAKAYDTLRYDNMPSPSHSLTPNL